MMVACEPRFPYAARERLFIERIARAEQLLVAQRRRVGQLEAAGFDITQALALLQVMESIADQFRTAWGHFRGYQRPPARDEPGVWPGWMPPSSARNVRHGDSVELASAPPATELATFPCPHCGLTLGLRSKGDGAVVYDIGQWLRLCQHQSLQTPALCQLFPSSAGAVH